MPAPWLLTVAAFGLALGCSKPPPTQPVGEQSAAQGDPQIERDPSLPDAVPDSKRQPPDAPHGLQLANLHCTRCHLLPEPGDLPRDRWPFAIQWMAHYLGHDSFTGPQRSVVIEQLMPDVPLVSKDELRSIEDYFVHLAPDELAPDEVFAEPLPESEFFAARDANFLPAPRLVSCLRIDEKRQVVYAGDGRDHKLWEFSPTGVPLARHDCRGTQPVSVQILSDGFAAALIGDLLEDGDAGAVMIARRTSHGVKYEFPAENFYRTAHAQLSDLDGDGIGDAIVCGFGAQHLGSLSIFWGGAGGRSDLLHRRGSLRTAVRDFDSDGDPDLLLLTAQGYHELSWFRNDGQRKFAGRQIWLKRPSFSANGFRLADFNGDGLEDLLVICGNNMEMANPPIRPYHGVYVFQGLGGVQFEQVFFQRLPGAIAAEPADFDSDGDLDLAVISSLPDWRVENPVSVLILENRGRFEFSASTIDATRGTQWMSLDTGDLDADGDIDVILGMLDVVPGVPESAVARFREVTTRQAALMILENK